MNYYEITGDDARDVGWYDALDQAFRFELVRHLVRAGDRVVDLGCGLGALKNYLPAGIEYIGLEREKALFELARSRVGASILNLDFEKNEIPSGDLVVAIGVGISSGEAADLGKLAHRMREAASRTYMLCAANENAPLGLVLESGFAPMDFGVKWTRFENVDSNGEIPSAEACVMEAISRLDVDDPVSLAHAWFTAGLDERLLSLLPELPEELRQLYRQKLEME